MRRRPGPVARRGRRIPTIRTVKNALFGWLLAGGLAVGCWSCSEKSHPLPSYPVPDIPAEPEELRTEPYDWEAARTRIPSVTDLVLVYGGGHHRVPFRWSKERMAHYVAYDDPEGRASWLFDGFLFLEIMDPGPSGAGKKFANGYTYQDKPLESASRDDWQRLIDYCFESDGGIGALEAAVAEAAAGLGEPPAKRRVVMSIPEPIVYRTVDDRSTVYWGAIDGEPLDFAKPDDRARACQWFIDRVRYEFDRKKYRYVELAGFYWLAEKSTDTQGILRTVAEYLDGLKYSFNWIPYFNAAGYAQWKTFGFHNAYLQPNYFFNASLPVSRLDEACALAEKYDMQMELEFDENALAARGMAYRLRDYLEAFRRHGIWADRRLAYYQGSSALQSLKESSDAADRALYHEFCRFVVTRPLRSAD